VPVTCCSRTCRSRDLRALDEHDLVPSPRLVDVDDDPEHVSKPPFSTSSCNRARGALLGGTTSPREQLRWIFKESFALWRTLRLGGYMAPMRR
jgi:hypothetical protein